MPIEVDEASGSGRRARLGRGALGAVAVLALGAGAIAWSKRGDDGPAYRTAVVGTQSVSHQLHGVGTIEPVSQATVAFPVAGTVESVAVKVGDRVTVGAVLAQLSTASFDQSIHTAQETLAQAELALENARNGIDPNTGSSGAAGSARSSSGATVPVATTPPTTAAPVTQAAAADEGGRTGGGSGGGAATNGGDAGGDLAALQAAVLSAQQAVDAATRKVDQAFASAQSVCRLSGDAGTGGAAPRTSSPPTTSTPTTTTTTSPPPSGAPTTTVVSPTSTTVVAPSTTTPPSTTEPPTTEPPTTTTAPDASPSTTTTTPGSSEEREVDVTACYTALQGVLTQQQTLRDAQGTLTRAASALDAALVQRAAQSATSSSAGAAASSATSGTRTTTTSTSTYTPSSSELVALQAAIDGANVGVLVAEQAKKQATILSPIDGVVQAVAITVGTTVEAASSTARITVAGDGGSEATVQVSVDDLPHVSQGLTATVDPDGSAAPISGTIVGVGLVPTTSTTGTTYPVTIALSSSNGLRSGSVGSVSITTATDDDSLAVPTSAVHRDADGAAMVTVVDGGTTREVTVELGAIGATWTAVRSGLSAGDVVVLADLHAALPTSATASNSNATATNGAGGNFQPGQFTFPGGAAGGFPAAPR